jgi:hypothetical protein
VFLLLFSLVKISFCSLFLYLLHLFSVKMNKEERLELMFDEDQELLARFLGLNPLIPRDLPENLAPARESANVSASTHTLVRMGLLPMSPIFSSNDMVALSYVRSHVDGLYQLDDQNHSRQAILPALGQEKNTSQEPESAAHSDNEMVDVGSSTQGPVWPSDIVLAESFCPAVALSRFPYLFLRGDISQKVASRFFDANKFWDRGWDLYVNMCISS